MDPLLVVVLIIGGLLLMGFWINKRFSDFGENQKPSAELLEIVRMLQSSSSEDRKILLENLQSNTKNLNERLDTAARIIGDVQKNVGEMSEIGRSMRDLQEFLQSPKIRGNIGEQVLKELLGQMLPKSSFHLQYAFKSGNKVDAAIKTTAGIVPIDSKFPMEAFRRMNSLNGAEKRLAEKQFEKSVREHIEVIGKKYILTDEGTIDYALMYVPSESVYYEIVNNASLFEYAGKMRVLPVSPTTFYAYMRAILMSFEGQKIEAKAREILSSIRAVQKDYTKVEGELSVLQKHLNSAYNKIGEVFNSFGRLGQKISNTANLGETPKTKELE